MPRHPLPAQARGEQTEPGGLALELASSEDERREHERGETFVALYDYERERAGQLSFRAGQRMTLLSKIDSDWFRARLDDGQTGTVPARLFVPTAHRAAYTGVQSRSPTRTRSRSPTRTRSRSPTQTRSRSVSPTRRMGATHRRYASPSRSGRGSPLRSTVVQMHNMVDHSESIADEDIPLLEADVKTECEANGVVRSVTIVPDYAESANAVVYVQFERAADASRAVVFFNDADADGTKDRTTAKLFSELEFDKIKSTEIERRKQRRRGAQVRRVSRTSGQGPADMARWFAHEITEEVRAALLDEGEDLTSAFHRMDKNGDGYLTASEFRRGLRELTDTGLSAEEMDLLMDEFDADGDNEIDYKEFISAFRRSARAQKLAGRVQTDLRKRLRHNRDDLLAVLDEFDGAGDGLLTSSDVRRALHQQGLTKSETDQLMRVFAVRGGDQIDFAGLLEVVLHEAGLPSPRYSPRSDRSSGWRQRRSTIDESVPVVHRSPSRADHFRRSRGTRRADRSRRQEDRHDRVARWFAHEITEEVRAALLDEGEDLTSAFHRMDKNGDGYLTASEFRRGLRELTDTGLSAEEMDLLMDEFDADGDNEIDYKEFISAFRRSARAQKLAGRVQTDLRKRLRHNRDDLLAVLDEFDGAGDGLLTSSDVRRALHQQGLTKSETDQLMRVFAVRGGDQIDFAGLLEVVLHEAGLPSPRRSGSRPSTRSPRSDRSSDRGASRLDQRRRSDRLKVVHVRDYIEATARLLRERDTSSLENDVEREMAEFGTVNGVLIVLPASSSPSHRKVETYVRFTTEIAATMAEQALRDNGYRVVLLEEAEYWQIEDENGHGDSTPLHRETWRDREAKAKRLAQVIGKDLRDAFPHGADLRSTFRWMDTNGDGALSHDELKAGLRDLTDRHLSDDKLRNIVELFDANGDGKIQYREFCDIFDAYDRAESTANDLLSKIRSYSNHDDTELRRIFKSFDVNGDGKLSRAEFQRGLRRLIQVDLDSAQMDDIMKVVDADGDGEIDLEEFLTAATPKPRVKTTSQSASALSGHLEVRVVKCTNLLPRKGKATATPCVKMSIGQGNNKQEWKSQYQKQTLDPQFNDRVKAVFDVHDEGSTLTSNALSRLTVQVCDFQVLGRDKLLGEVDIDLRKEFGNSWTTGEQSKRHKWPLADYENQINADETRARYPTEPYGLVELDIKFIPRRVDHTPAPVPDGKLTVKVAGCNDLLPKDRNGRSDPYAKVELLQGENYTDVQNFRTSTIPKTLNPVFTDRPKVFRVDYESFKNDGCWLRVTVFDDGKHQKDEQEGMIQLNLNDRFKGQWTTNLLQLRESIALTDPDKTIPVPESRRHLEHPYGTVEVHLDLVGSRIPAVGMPEPEPEPEPVASFRPSTAAVPTEPVCLLRREGGSLRIHPDGKRLLEALGEAPVAVVAITGLGRTGKSFLLNQLLGRGPSGKWSRDHLSSRFGMDTDGTSGVWCCLVPTEMWLHEEAPNTRLLLIDTESLGSSRSTSRDGIGWDVQCFVLSVLLSSLLVYNSLGEIDESAIEQLYMVRDLTQHIHVSAASDTPQASRKADTGDTLARYTPDFMWLLRDFEPSTAAASTFDSTELQYHLEAGLEERKPRARARTTSDSTLTRIQEQNQTRAAFRRTFPKHCCRALVCPVDYTDDLSDLSTLPPQSFRPDFLVQVEGLRDDIFRMVKPKQLFGQTVSARLLLTLLRSYVDDLNRRMAPDIRRAWDTSEGRVLDDVYLSAREQYESGLHQLCAECEEIFLYECIHPAGVTEAKEIGSQPQLIAQIEDGETIEVFDRASVDRGSRQGTVERLRTHCGWVSKEAGSKRLFVEVQHLEMREKIALKQVRGCLRNVDSLLRGDIPGVRGSNANRKKARELCSSVWGELDEQLTEAKTLEWSNSRVSELTKLLRHYSKLQSTDVREADIDHMLKLLRDLSDLQWHAPIDEPAGAAVSVLGAQTKATSTNARSITDHEFFTTTLIRPKEGFGINVGHNCEILDFTPAPGGRKSVAETAGVLPGMTIVEVNGTPVRDKKGVMAAITRGRSTKTTFKFRNASSSMRARSASPSSSRAMSTRRFDEEAALRRTQLGDAHSRQQRRVLLTREEFDEGHWRLAAEAVAKFERSAAVPTVETVLRWRQKLDREIKDIYSTKLQELERDSITQCESLMHELCEGLLRRVRYGNFDYPRGEADYQRALTEMMAVYDAEATRRGGPAKDLVARKAITQELPQVFKAFLERQMEIEATKNRGLETVLERMFEQGMGHEDDLATWRRHRHYQEQEQEQLYGRQGRSGAMRRSPGR